MKPIHPFLKAARTCSEAEFVQEHPYAMLVVEPFTKMDSSKFSTLPAGAGPTSTWSLVPLRKRPGANAFTGMITIGRAANNDIVLPAEDLSKFHAYVMEVGGKHRLTDAGSTYGTTVNKQRLKARESVELADGVEVELASIHLTYMKPTTLFRYLREFEPTPTTTQ